MVRENVFSPWGVFAGAERVKEKFSSIAYVSGITGDYPESLRSVGRSVGPKGAARQAAGKKRRERLSRRNSARYDGI